MTAARDHPDKEVAQVDASVLEDMFWSLSVQRGRGLGSFPQVAMGMDDQPTLFIVNPKKPVKKLRYGYRFGFSEHELQRLRQVSARRLPPRVLSWAEHDAAHGHRRR